MLERIHKSLIVKHRFVVSSLLLLHLLQEQILLHKGIIQLRIRIAKLVVINKELKPLS